MIALGLVLLTALAYCRVVNNGFIWDDDVVTTNNVTLGSLHGLWQVWFQPGVINQWYPLTQTTIWIEDQLWGLNPAGYHVVNVLLHAANAVMVWLVLRRLAVPGALLAAAVFAAHPVYVESVAWVMERKNVLSGLCYLGALWLYLTHRKGGPAGEGPPPAGAYVLSLLLYVAALLSKSVTSSLPAVILLITWWKRGRLSWRDVPGLVPFFAFGIAMGAMTAWMEGHFVGATGPEWNLSFLQRCLIAGRALWFYAGKLLWPAGLMFIYPKWSIDPHRPWNYVFPLGAVALVITLWAWRRRLGRGPLTAVLFFGGTLLPALSFVNVYPMRYSYVADHFQYLASVGIIALVAAALTIAARKIVPPKMRAWPTAAAAVLVAVLALLTIEQTGVYRSLDTLWADVLAKNPTAWMAHQNLGTLMLDRGDLDAAAQQFHDALVLKPDHAEAWTGLGTIAARRGDPAAAAKCFRQALAQLPNSSLPAIRASRAKAHYNLALSLTQLGRRDEAIEQYRLSLSDDPANVLAWNNLGLLLTDAGQLDAAVATLEKAVSLSPGSPIPHTALANALLRKGDPAGAVTQCEQALRIAPQFTPAIQILAAARSRMHAPHH